MCRYRAWQDIKAFVDTQLPALLHQLPPANPISSQDLAALSASTIGSFAQTAHPIETTAQMAERQSQEYDVVVQLLLPVVRALPKDRVSQVMALRNGSPAGCCNYAAAEPVKQDAAIEATAGEVAGEAAAATAVTAAATTEATPAAAEATTEVIATAAEGTSAITAATAEAAAETTAEATAAKATAAEAACIPRAATDLFLHELHSTALFRVVRDCLGRLQQTADHALRQGSANRDRLSAADVSSETTRPSDSAESPKSSTVWHESDVTSSPCTSAAEMADGKSAQHVCQQRVEDLHSQSCLVQQQRSGAEVHQSHSSQLPLAASGPSFIQDQDCKAPPAEQTAEEATVLSDNMLTEMICMLLLLVPRTAWHHACDEVWCMQWWCHTVVHLLVLVGKYLTTIMQQLYGACPFVMCFTLLSNSLVSPCPLYLMAAFCQVSVC